MDAPNNLDKVESAANIFVRLAVDGQSFEIPVSEVDFTKEVDIERVREMGLYPDGYAINAIDVDGSLSFAGSVVRLPNGKTKNLDDLLFDDEGSPIVFDTTIVHEDPEGEGSDDTDTLENCIVTTSEFSASSEESTESSYEFMAQRVN